MTVAYSFVPNQDMYFGKGFAGFLTKRDHDMSLALSVMLARKHVGPVVIYTDAWGEDLLKPLNLPITKFHTDYKRAPDENTFWARRKLVALASHQDLPFIHIDGDSFIWAPLPDRLINTKAPAVFQYREEYSHHKWYLRAVKAVRHNVKGLPKWFNVAEDTRPYCCGFIYVPDRTFLVRWIELANELLSNAGFRDYGVSHEVELMCPMALVEQFTLSVLDKKTRRPQTLLDYGSEVKFTHTMGHIKRYPRVILQVERKLKQLFPEVFTHIDKLNPSTSRSFKVDEDLSNTNATNYHLPLTTL